MDELLEYIEILNKYKLRKIEVIGNIAHVESKYQEFYDLIHSGEITSDEDAAAHYGMKLTDKSFRRLKNGLKERLGNMLFLIDLENDKFSAYERKKNKLMAQYSQVILLNSRGAKEAAVELIKKALKTAEEIEVTKFLIEFYDILSSYYGIKEGNDKQFHFYIKKLKEQNYILKAEYQADIAVRMLRQPYVKNKSYKPEMAQEAEIALNELSIYEGKVTTTKFIAYYYLVALMKYMHKNEYVGGIEICKVAIKKISSKKLSFRSFVNVFYHNLIAMLVYKKRYTEAAQAYEDCKPYIEEGRSNWFKNQELYTSLLLHQEKYEEAIEVFRKVSAHKNYTKIPFHYQETWKITEAWLRFFSKEETDKNFRVSKFLNEVPTFAQDKSGMNIQILLVQIAWKIRQGKYEDIGEKIDALKKYRSRYLKQDTNMRSNRMIGMIIKLSGENFHKSNTLTKTKTMLTEMSTEAPNILDEGHDLEILPYESAWKAIIEECEDAFH